MFCDPCECCVQPSAYMIVMTLSGVDVAAIISHTFRNLSFGVPQILLDHLRRVAAKCSFISWKTQRGCCSVSSTLAKPSSPIS